MTRHVLMEEMESRVFLSTTPAAVGSVLNSAVKADRVQVQIDLIKFRGDVDSFGSTFLTDAVHIRNDDPHQATTVVPLLKQMRTDISAMRTTLHQDRLAADATVLADQSVILKELLKILKDRGNPAAVAADKQVLLADRITLQNDMVAGLNSRIATRQAAESTLLADGQAIVAAALTDPNATSKLQADLAKWTTDHSAGNTAFVSDLQKLVADRTQLITDLTALQNA